MPSDFNAKVIAEFRANRGQVGGVLADTPIILIHHSGARTRNELIAPLAYMPQADGRLVIAASNGGSPAHPAWYLNLEANPEVQVQVKGEKFAARAHTVQGAERAVLWAKMLEIYGPYAEYQTKTDRQIPVVVLKPV